MLREVAQHMPAEDTQILPAQTVISNAGEQEAKLIVDGRTQSTPVP
jgi:hypothetical protein